MRSPRISTTWLFSMVPDLASNSRPARMAITWSGGASNFPVC